MRFNMLHASVKRFQTFKEKFETRFRVNFSTSGAPEVYLSPSDWSHAYKIYCGDRERVSAKVNASGDTVKCKFQLDNVIYIGTLLREEAFKFGFIEK